MNLTIKYLITAVILGIFSYIVGCGSNYDYKSDVDIQINYSHNDALPGRVISIKEFSNGDLVLLHRVDGGITCSIYDNAKKTMVSLVTWSHTQVPLIELSACRERVYYVTYNDSVDNADCKIIIYNSLSKEINTLCSHEYIITNLSVSERLVAYADENGKIVLHSDGGDSENIGVTSKRANIILDSSRNRVAWLDTNHDKNQISIYNVIEKNKLHMTLSESDVLDLLLSNSGEVLGVVGKQNGSYRTSIYDVETGNQICIVDGRVFYFVPMKQQMLVAREGYIWLLSSFDDPADVVMKCPWPYFYMFTTFANNKFLTISILKEIPIIQYCCFTIK